jgi:murein DD-endopeptidase MepM/ murein hydrolase activator NlpD
VRRRRVAPASVAAVAVAAAAAAVTALALAGCPRPRPRAIPTYRLDEGLAGARGTWHHVEPGDTLASLAARYSAAPEDIVEINDLLHPLAPGEDVFVPDAEGTFGLPSPAPAAAIARAPGDPVVPDEKPEALGRAALAALGCLSWPLDGGVVTSPFGIRTGKNHDGLDVAAPEGTPVHAAADGEVIYAGDELAGYGNLVVIRHAPGLATVYAHNRKILVSVGEHVARGATIAEVGHTGRATGPHVHFEVRVGEIPRNPRLFLPPDCAEGGAEAR